MSGSDLHHLAAAYSLDALTVVERRAFGAHQPSCDICSSEVHDFRETAAILGQGVSASPPPSLKGRVMSGVAQIRQVPPAMPGDVINLASKRRWRPTRTVLTSVAAVLIAVVGTAAGFMLTGRTDDVSELLAAPDAVVTSLDGQGTLRVVWSPERSELAIVGDALDDPGVGATYQLWFLHENGEVGSAGLFRPDESGAVRVVLPVEGAEGIGFGVTMEPKDGSPRPTSPVIHSGKF